MASYLNQQYPNTYHPRRTDLTDSFNHHTNPQIPATNLAPTQAMNGTLQSRLPAAQPLTIPTPFIPIPNWNQPFLPPGTNIPNQYSRPTPLLNHQWPKGFASHQQQLVPHHALQAIPLTNQHIPRTNFSPPPEPLQMQPVPTLAPTVTYAQVANPQYSSATGIQLPTTHLQNQLPHSHLPHGGNYQNQEAQRATSARG